MCRRLVITAPARQLAAAFDAEPHSTAQRLRPSWNVAPTRPVPSLLLHCGGRCQRSAGSPHWRPWVVPMCGHRFSPWAAIFLPRGGQVVPRLVGQWRHPLSAEGVGESDAFAVGDDDVGVVQEPVDERGGDGGGHELVEAGGVEV